MNWGTKLLIGMISFMLFISALVTMMIMKHGEDGLIDDNYYERGQDFDSEFKLRQATIDSEKVPDLIAGKDSLYIKFSSEVDYLITLKRSSSVTMDKTYKSNASSRQFAIARTEIANGPWRVRVEFQEKNKNYIHETRILLR